MVGVMWDSVILCIVLRLTSDGSAAYILCEGEILFVSKGPTFDETVYECFNDLLDGLEPGGLYTMLRSKGEIIKRAVVLLSFSDRCALEKSMLNGIAYSLYDREIQRQSIIRWLQRMNYADSISKIERVVFEEQVGLKSIEILRLQINYEYLTMMIMF